MTHTFVFWADPGGQQAYELDKKALMRALDVFPQYKEDIMAVGEERLINDKKKAEKKDRAIRIADHPLDVHRSALSALRDRLAADASDASALAGACGWRQAGASWGKGGGGVRAHPTG